MITPEPAVASAEAKQGSAAAERHWAFKNTLQRWALPHEAGKFQVLPEAGQLICRFKRKARKGRGHG